jgi:hypothetical protein
MSPDRGFRPDSKRDGSREHPWHPPADACTRDPHQQCTSFDELDSTLAVDHDLVRILSRFDNALHEAAQMMWPTINMAVR